MNWLVDFCTEWNYLAWLKIQRRGKSLTGNVKWERCKKLTSTTDYTQIFFGRKFKNPNEPEERNDNDLGKDINEIDNCQDNNYIKHSDRCLIWFNSVRLDINLQWGAWSQTYWFDCLSNWMLKNSSWPNWRIKLNKSIVHPNRDWKKIAEILKSEQEKQKNPIWEVHKEESRLFWAIWRWCVCLKWVINNNHRDHLLIEIKEKSEMLHKEVVEKLAENESMLSTNFDYANHVQNYWDLKTTIFNEASDSLFISINDIWKKLNSLNIDLWEEYTKKAMDAQKVWKENASLLKKYRDSKDLSMISETSKAVEKIDDLRTNLIILMDEGLQQMEDCESILINYDCNISTIYFSISEIDGIKGFNCKFDDYEEDYMELTFGYSEGNQIWISANIKESNRWKYYLKLELKENKFWELASNKIQGFYLSQNPKVINTFKIISEINESNNDAVLYLKITAWKTDEIENFKSKIQSLILDNLQNKFIKANINESDDNKMLVRNRRPEEDSDSQIMSNQESQEEMIDTKMQRRERISKLVDRRTQNKNKMNKRLTYE